MRILTSGNSFLNLEGQAVHALAHVGTPHSQPDPRIAGNQDHLRRSALTTAAARSGEIDLGIRTRAPSSMNTSIASPLALSMEGIGPETTTSAKPVALLRNSCRQR